MPILPHLTSLQFITNLLLKFEVLLSASRSLKELMLAITYPPLTSFTSKAVV